MDRQSQIAVMEKCVCLKNQFVSRKGRKRYADDADLNDAEQCRKQHFPKVKAEPGRNIQVWVNVMNIVKSLKPGDSVIGDVPIIEAQIEQQKSGNELRPIGKGYYMEQAERLRRSPIQCQQRRRSDNRCSDKKGCRREAAIDY